MTRGNPKESPVEEIISYTTASVGGSVSISNAVGGDAVNIQDGGNSITIDGAVSVTSVVGATVVAGRKTVASAGTAEALGASTALTQGVIIMALKTNTNNVFVGTSSVDSTSDKQMELEPGESTAIAINNLNKIYVDVTTNGEGVSYIGS